VIEGPSLADLVAATDPALDAEMRARLDTTMAALGAIKAAAEGGFAYDMMLAQGNAEGEALIMAGVNGLIDQTRSIERIVAALGLDAVAFEGSDSLDNPGAVFQ
jgi:putative iron-regulated protein